MKLFTLLAASVIISGCSVLSENEDRYKDCRFYHKIYGPEVMEHVYCPIGE